MRLRRLLGTALATALGSVALTAVSTAPASAATYQTRIVGADGPAFSSYSKPVQYGDSINIALNVEAYIDGTWEQVYDGSLTVKRRIAGTSTTTTVATSDSAYLYESTPAKGNATYTITYSGVEGTYEASGASTTVKGIQRAVTGQGISGDRTGFKGKIAPKARKKLTVYKKVGKRWDRFKTTRTTARGRWKVYLPAPRRGGTFKWKLVFAGDKRFAKSVVTGTTYTYRTAPVGRLR